MTTTTNRQLIGPAGKIAEVLGRSLAGPGPLKFLFTGQAGIGKTELANRLAADLTGDGGKYAIESVNGRKLSIHVVSDWQYSCATSCMFGTGWRVFVCNEVDTCPKDSQDLLLTFLDEMPARTAFIATSNLDLENLSPRFITRFQRHEIAAPEPEDIGRMLVEQEGVPALVAQQIAFLCGGCVRAALLDAAAWRNENAPKSAKPARVAQAGLAFA